MKVISNKKQSKEQIDKIVDRLKALHKQGMKKRTAKRKVCQEFNIKLTD